MAFYISPLVDIKEVDLSTTVPAVSSSIAVNVIRNSWRGKENVKHFTTNDGEFTDTYGYPTNNAGNFMDILSGVGYHMYGNALWSVTVRPSGATFSGLVSSAATSGASATFTTPPVSGTDAFTLADFAGGDVDLAGATILPVGPIDFVSTWRGASANRIKIAIVDSTNYNAIVRLKTAPQINFAIAPVVKSLDTILEAPTWVDTYGTVGASGATVQNYDAQKSFLVIVSHCPQGNDTTDKNQWNVVEVFNVSTSLSALDDQGRPRFVESKINQESKYIRCSLKSTLEDSAFVCNTMDYCTFAGGYDGDLNDNLEAECIAAFKLF